MKRKLVLFDIDGTLLLSHGAGRRAILAAIAGSHPWHDDYLTVRFDGKTDPQIVAELLSVAGVASPNAPELVDDILARYVTHLEAELARDGHRTEVLPGILALLEALEADTDVTVGLLTGNVRRGAALKLQSASLSPDRFVLGAFGCDDARRPALPLIAARRAEALFGRVPTGSEVVIIGDTPADIHCGAGIAARAVAVATGGYDLATLTAERPFAAFATLEDTSAVCEAILC